uniref:HD/PDEase domain-containing protein n=1 Tax=Panagrolaimus sp. PS1159 TaxID=55785 RepID=A0AC35FR92_9BILA
MSKRSGSPTKPRKSKLLKEGNPLLNDPSTDTSQWKAFNDSINVISKKDRKTVDWDYRNPDNFCVKNLGEGIGFASIPKACKPLIANPIFTRQHHINQLGPCYLVYPDANHSRYSHAIGTGFLAYRVVYKLQEKIVQSKESMTSSEMLCVIVAGLCHDLGHGPFSHLCEEFLVQEDGHKQMSVLLFEKILKEDDKAREALEKYLTDEDFEFIKQLINPPPYDHLFLKNIMKPEKAFLYAIVNNPISGVDVDKIDYLLRDSKRTGINGITQENIDRFLNQMQLHDDCCGDETFKWLAFPQNNTEILSVFFERRQMMHKHAYSYPKVLAITEMLKKAISSVLTVLELEKSDNTKITLKDCFKKENLDMYIRLTDEFIRIMIRYNISSNPVIVAAQKILKDIECQRFCKPILSFERKENFEIEYPCLNIESMKTSLKMCQNLSFPADDIIFIRKDFHGGKGLGINPMDHILFYSANKTEKASRRPFPAPQHESMLYIFAPYDCTFHDFETIEKAVREHISFYPELHPIQLFKIDENAS